MSLKWKCDPKFLPSDKIEIVSDIEGTIILVKWNGYNWLYDAAYWHNGEQKIVTLFEYEIRKREKE